VYDYTSVGMVNCLSAVCSYSAWVSKSDATFPQMWTPCCRCHPTGEGCPRRTPKKVSCPPPLMMDRKRSCCVCVCSEASISNLNLHLKQIMDKIRTLGLSKKQDTTVSYIVVVSLLPRSLSLAAGCSAGDGAACPRGGWFHLLHGGGEC